MKPSFFYIIFCYGNGGFAEDMTPSEPNWSLSGNHIHKTSEPRPNALFFLSDRVALPKRRNLLALHASLEWPLPITNYAP